MMSIEGLLIGLLYICLYAVILCIVVYALLFFAARFGLGIPPQIVNLIWAAVGLVIIIMIVSLLFGWRPGVPFRARAEPVTGGAVAALSARTTGDMPRLLTAIAPSLSHCNGPTNLIEKIIVRSVCGIMT
jgi:hypothetical protein